MLILQMFAVGVFAGLFYAVIRLRSPAPSAIGLVGLAGMLIGHAVITWVFS